MKNLLYILLLIPTLLSGQVTIYNPYDGVDFTYAWKGNMQVHTTESDGIFTVQEILDMYANNGYDIMSITDHDNYPTVDPDATWPWSDFITDPAPTAFWINTLDATDTIAAYYPDINGQGPMLAIKGNELTDQGEGLTINHTNVFFLELGYSDGPVGGEDTYFQDITNGGGLGIFNHPGRYNRTPQYYADYASQYDSIFAMELRDFDYPDDEYKWDSTNALLPADSLLWGMGNDDFHASYPYTEYGHYFMGDSLDANALRVALVNGHFTASTEYSGGNGTWAPILTGVTVSGTEITVTGSDVDSIRWFNNKTELLDAGGTIDVSNYVSTTNFVRAELYNTDGITRTQPFGIAAASDSTSAYGGNYFVSPNGSDSNPGTFTQPWATWQKAFDTAGRQDTVYFRGGVYQPTEPASGNNITYMIGDYSGSDTLVTSEMWADSGYIYFFAYPGETPILDCSLIGTDGRNYNSGMVLTYQHYLHFKGLTLRNVYQGRDYVTAGGIGANVCSNLIFEQMTVHNISGAAWSYLGANGRYGINHDTTLFINCDAYDNCDSLMQYGANPENPSLGGLADGWKYDNEAGAYVKWLGCRAWKNSDDAFNPSGSATVVIDNCWMFEGGGPPEAPGEGNGFKGGAIRHDVGTDTTLFISNVVSALNAAYSFALLDYDPYYKIRGNIHNNTSYGNYRGFVSQWGNTNGDPIAFSFKNNLVWQDTAGMNMRAADTATNNVFLTESSPFYYYVIEPSASDFVSLDVEELKGARQSDGSLPTVNFLRPAAGSALIDYGTDVGLNFSGDAPDVGAFEYSASTPSTSRSKSLRSGGKTQLWNGKRQIISFE